MESPSILLAFLAGILTVITPCVIPVLPAILSGSIGGKIRPIAIVIGMSITFTAMGALISAIGSLFASVAEYLRWFSIFFILGMGAVLFDDDLNQYYLKITSPLSNIQLFSNNPNTKEEGLFGALTLGMSLGIVWIPCVGPILGSILAYVAVHGNFMYGSLLLFVYSIGVGIPMLIIAYSGKSVSKKIKWFSIHGTLIKKISGIALILVGLMILFEIDKYLQTVLLPYFPPIL